MKQQEAWKEERERGISKMIGLLKFITCGSVDDGKSTLIGHILYDSKLLYTDQEEALELDSKVGSRGGKIDYSLLLDGLMAEREQGITIDVAYRYFTTEKRSFIVADTPGHEEYTRNMAVGASFADLAVILIDASQGVLVQTRRHARICALMGIRHFVFAVNKMDLVKYDQETFRKIEEQIKELQEELSLANVKIIPVSATEGDNVTTKSDNIPWYTGEPLLEYLETVDVREKSEEEGFYMPVQRVCRPNHTFRGFQGQIESGQISVGDEIVTLPSKEHAKVKSLLIGDKDAQTAEKGRPVTIQLDREVDVSRGCVLANKTELPVSKSFTATVFWMDDGELLPGKEYFVKIGTKEIPGIVTNIQYKIDVNTGEYIPANNLRKNEIAVCDVILQEEIVLDEFDDHKALGELILIDRITNMTSACGVIKNSEVDEETDLKCVFAHGKLKANGDIFEEFYYNMESMTVTKIKPSGKSYTIGDEIPVEGESYQYPDYFDVIVFRDKVAVQIRDRKVSAILPIEEYEYKGLPLINGRGFKILVDSKEKADKLFAELKEQGYKGNLALHPYLASGWNRVQVYDYMGFDHFYSETDFKNPTMYRKYISDESDFKKIEELYEKRTEKDEPFYLFNVTMQNHGGFDKTYSNFHNDIQITDNHKNEQAEQYLSLVKKTDDAFKQLVEYFSKVKEPTIIVMYGDHQPAVQSSFYDSLFGKSAGSLTNEELMNKYRTPFIIWANYDIKEKTIDKMSANYLTAYEMNEAGLETSPYQKFLLKLRKKLPVLTAMGCFDKKGKYYESALESPYSDMVKEYQILQYNNLIDTKHTVNSFFYLSDEQKK